MRIDPLHLPPPAAVEPGAAAVASSAAAVAPGQFQTVLNEQLRGEGLEFSKHAVERLQQRGVEVSSSTLQRLTDGVQRAAGKGAKNTLVLVDDLAFVVSVENKKVVTVAESSTLQDRVFTNIDSVVIG